MAASLASSPAIADVLGALQQQAVRLFGHGDALLDPVAVFDRPYSTVVRLRVQRPEREPAYAFIKIYKDRPLLPYEIPRTTAEVVTAEFEATARLHAALAGRPGFAAARPIAMLPDLGAIVTSELQGTGLDAVLRRSRWASTRALQSMATRVGAWLRAYQAAGDSAEPAMWSAAEARAYLDDRLRYITPRVLDSSVRDEALALFDRLAAPISRRQERMVAIHADLCPGNILVVPGSGVAVLDFATAQHGTRFHDLAHLYLHLEFARRRSRGRFNVSAVQDALLAGFDRLSAGADPLFRLMLLQHAVCHVTQLADGNRWPRPAWRALVRWRWRQCLSMPALAGPNAVPGRSECCEPA